MSIKLRRAVNAFVIGFLAGLGGLLLANLDAVSDAVVVGDVTSLRILIVPMIVGAIGAGIRSLQSNSPLPSPEPSEN